MDKNLAALLRRDCRTVQVRFDDGAGAAGFGPVDDEYESRPTSMTARGVAAAQAQKSQALYSYVTQLDLKPGDVVVVPARDEIKLATVVSVDEDVDIEPQASKTYRWVVDVVDMVRHQANMDRNREIESLAADAQRASMRNAFANAVLGQVTGPNHDKLAGLLGMAQTGDLA